MNIQSIDPKKTAVMVIDMQNDFVKPGAPLYVHMGYEFSESLARFLDKCRELGMLIIYTKNVLRADGRDRGKAGEFCQPIKDGLALIDGTPGGEIFDVVAPKEDDVVIKKQKYSSFYGTNLDNILSNCGIDTLVITGVCTEACCFSTARDAGYRNFNIAFLSDLTGTIDYPDMGFGAMTALEMHHAMLTNIALSTAAVMTSEELLNLAK